MCGGNQTSLTMQKKKMATSVSSSLKRVSLSVQLQFLWHWLLTGGTVISVSLIAVMPTVLEKSVFYEYLSVACFPWATDTISTLLFSNN